MLRRSLLIAGIGLLPALSRTGRAKAAEAAVPLQDSERMRVDAALRKNGYQLAGELRRKGTLISAIAQKNGSAWRLIVDAGNGEIVGRRLLGSPPSIAKAASLSD